jgi:hypothetical protein
MPSGFFHLRYSNFSAVISLPKLPDLEFKIDEKAEIEAIRREIVS